MRQKWSPDSWRIKPIQYVPDFPDQSELKSVETRLKEFPPLVFPCEVCKLKKTLATVAKGDAFLLQGGDCAESFLERSANDARDLFRLFMQMAMVLSFASRTPVVKVGRIAGQFGKPRSAPTENIDGIELPSYHGDIVNDIAFTPEGRKPDPQRQIMAYYQSAETLNLLRALSKGDDVNLENVHRWMLNFVSNSPQSVRYNILAERITKTIQIIQNSNPIYDNNIEFYLDDFYTSHEALLLGYEESMTRSDENTGDWYCTSAHMLWIGDRTRQLDHAHVEYMRGIRNPIGLKCGPSLQGDDLIRLIDILNPEDEAGRLTLITRFGSDKIGDHLPELVRRVNVEGRTVVWLCDPMHGNTIKTAFGYKTRPFDQIISEVRSFINIHKAEGTHAGGLHLEMTGKNVTECTGGARALTDADLKYLYETCCDPRLNYEQAMDIAFLTAECLYKNS